MSHYLGVSIGEECTGTKPTCSHAVSLQVKDAQEKRGSRWIDQGLMNGIEIFRLLARLPSDMAAESRAHFEQYRACRNDATSVKQRYKKHNRQAVTVLPNPTEVIPVPAQKSRPVKPPRKSAKRASNASPSGGEDNNDDDEEEEITVTSRGAISPYDIGVIKDTEKPPKAFLKYSATRLNVKRKRRSPRTTAPPYTNDPLDPFTPITAEMVMRAFVDHKVGPCCHGSPDNVCATSDDAGARGWEWDPELFACPIPVWAPVQYPLRIQNLVSKCVITGKEKLNPDDFRNACEGCMKRFPAHTVKLTTCSQTLFEEGQMNIAGRTDRFDELRWVYLVLYYLARVTGKRYDVRNFGVVNIATSTDLKHKINLVAYREYLLKCGHVAVYEPDNFPGAQWGFVPPGVKAEAYAAAVARARGEGGDKKKKPKAKRRRRRRSRCEYDEDGDDDDDDGLEAISVKKTSSSTQKGPVVQAFSTGRATLVGVQSERSVKIAEAKIIPYIASFIRKLPPVPPEQRTTKKRKTAASAVVV